MISILSKVSSPVVSPAAAGIRISDTAAGHPVVASTQDAGEARYCPPAPRFGQLAAELKQMLSLQPDVRSAYLTEARPQQGTGLMNLVLVVKGDTKRRSLFEMLKRTMRAGLSPDQPFDVVHIDDAPKAVVFRLADVTLPFYSKTFDGRRRRASDVVEALDVTRRYTSDLDIGASYASLGRA
jgi:hypothetical protein